MMYHSDSTLYTNIDVVKFLPSGMLFSFNLFFFLFTIYNNTFIQYLLLDIKQGTRHRVDQEATPAHLSGVRVLPGVPACSPGVSG